MFKCIRGGEKIKNKILNGNTPQLNFMKNVCPWIILFGFYFTSNTKNPIKICLHLCSSVSSNTTEINWIIERRIQNLPFHTIKYPFYLFPNIYLFIFICMSFNRSCWVVCLQSNFTLLLILFFNQNFFKLLNTGIVFI